MSLLLPEYIEDDDELEGLEGEQKTPKEYGIDFGTGQLTGEIGRASCRERV